ncbi:hypothetical protein KM043_007412 [Ampulex compressa]|nr:hypothetical protein KM043_007412 [Ampulex compressa]
MVGWDGGRAGRDERLHATTNDAPCRRRRPVYTANLPMHRRPIRLLASPPRRLIFTADPSSDRRALSLSRKTSCRQTPLNFVPLRVCRLDKQDPPALPTRLFPVPFDYRQASDAPPTIDRRRLPPRLQLSPPSRPSSPRPFDLVVRDFGIEG